MTPFVFVHSTVAFLQPPPSRVNAVGASAVAQSQVLQPLGLATHCPVVLMPPVPSVFLLTMQY